MGGSRESGPLGRGQTCGCVPSRTPGPLGRNDQGDPGVMAQQGDTPGPVGINDFHPARLVNAKGPRIPVAASDYYGSAPIVGIGVSSVTRIPVPGTGLYIELTPRGWVPKGGSTSALFIQDEAGKRVLRLDYGYNKNTGNVEYHWNQKGTFKEFGIADHTPAGSMGEGLFKGAKFLKYAGRVFLVAGIAMDAYSIVTAKKKLRQVVRVTSGWAGAEAGAYYLGAAGAEWGSVEPGGGTAIGGLGGSVIGGIFGYFGASWVAGKTYDWVEETYFEPVELSDSN